MINHEYTDHQMMEFRSHWWRCRTKLLDLIEKATLADWQAREAWEKVQAAKHELMAARHFPGSNQPKFPDWFPKELKDE